MREQLLIDRLEPCRAAPRRAAPRPWQRIARALIRGVLLIAIGLVLELLGAQVVDVLAYLGAITIVLALLSWLPSPALALGACALAAWSPSLIDGCAPGSLWFDYFCGGPYYLHLMLLWGLLGVVAGRWIRSRPPHAQTLSVLIAGLAAVLALAVYKHRNPWEVVPYSGAWLELALEAGLVIVVLAICLLLAERLPLAAREVLTQMGRMSLSIYVLHFVALAAVAQVRTTDDSWLVLAGLVGGAAAVATLWRRYGLGRGPIEMATDWLVRTAAPYAR